MDAIELSTPEEGPRLLVVEEDAELLELMQRVLEHEGLAVTAARSAAEALEALYLPRPPEVVSLATGVRGLDLPRFLGELWTRNPAAQVVVCSGAEPPRLPGVTFLRKPFELEELVVTLAGVRPDRARNDPDPQLELPFAGRLASGG